MNTGRYTLKSFLTDANLEQIIVPELQRDYVWKPDNVKRLLSSIKEDAEKETIRQEHIDSNAIKNLPPNLREILERELEGKKAFSNIGFIYAYYDPEFSDRYILIDGQQRITTLFLLLLNLHIKEEKQAIFRRTYFKREYPKFDYKVRESAHSFLIHFIDYCLSNGSLITLKDQHWYYSNYENDVTIQSLLVNYQVIDDFTSTNDLSLEYLESNTEFYYFDTNKTEQGEELYIYMNSRGESVTNNENIKASLLDGLSEQKKNEWGRKWESWQSFFWRNKAYNKSADRGFDEFLKCIKIIEEFGIRENNTIPTSALPVREIKESKKFNIKEVSPDNIESYIVGLKYLQKLELGIYFDKNWLTGNLDGAGYIKLLPLLMYSRKYPDAGVTKVKRFARFFYNIVRFEAISRNPYSSVIQVLQLTHRFLEKGLSDIADIIQFKTEKNNNILTIEEIWKLNLYKNAKDETGRVEMEDVFWQAEDFKFLWGSVHFILYCIGFEPDMEAGRIFNFSLFKFFFTHIKNLFNTPDDLLRRALLTKGDYTIHDGFTPSLGGKRFSFIIDSMTWRWAFNSPYRVKIFKDLLRDYHKHKIQNIQSSFNVILERIIEEYLEGNPEKDWRYYFIKNPEVLAYCNQKFVCFVDEELDKIYLLRDVKAGLNSTKKLKELLNLT